MDIAAATAMLKLLQLLIGALLQLLYSRLLHIFVPRSLL
jgi:hypothetical protein